MECPFDRVTIMIEDRLVEFLNDPKLGQPAVLKLFEQFCDEDFHKEFSAIDEQFVKETLDQLEIEVRAGCLLNVYNYMEADPRENVIHVNPEWLCEYTSSDTPVDEKARHEHLFLQKGLQEIGNLLKRLFLQHLRKNKLSTSPKISGKEREDLNFNPDEGAKAAKSTFKEESAGCGLEEILSGGRMFHETNPQNLRSHFEVTCITLETRGKRNKLFEISDAFISKKKKQLSEFRPSENHLKPCSANDSQHRKMGAPHYFPWDGATGPSNSERKV